MPKWRASAAPTPSIVGINPFVASTMTELGINVDITPTALDLDDRIALLLDELTIAR